MSIRLLEEAAQLDLKPSAKLVLMAFADSADKDTRIAYPGLERVQQWAGVSRSRALELVADLVSAGHLERRAAAHRGRRAEFVVLPTLVIPDRKGSGPSDSARPIRSGTSDPFAEGKGPIQTAKGSDLAATGSDVSDPFRQELPPVPPEVKTFTSEVAPRRADAERLCNLLADLIEANGAKRPTVTQKWRDAARLMLDRDGRTEEQITTAIRWCQADEFWRANVLSMPTLREQYERLRLQAQRGTRPGPSTVDTRVTATLARAAELRAARLEAS